MKKLLYLFLGCSLLCWAEIGSALEQHNAEVIANVNLRQTPWLDGKIITVLEKGTHVLIKDRRGDWVQIAFENETYGLKAWVYAEYIKEIHNHDEIASSSSGAEGKEPERPEESHEDKRLTEGPSTAQALEEEQPLENEMSQPSQEAAITERERHFNQKDYSFDPGEEFQENMLPKEGVSGVDDLARKELAIASVMGNFPTYEELKGFIGLLLVISSIALCFVGLAFFTKATQIAKINRETARQLARAKKKFAENEPREKERSRLPRTPRLQEVDFVVQGRAYGGFIGNVSAGGAFIETRESFSIGREITLTFPSPAKNGCVKMSGKIVRTDSKGIGVKFNNHP